MPRADDPPPPAAKASFSSIAGGTNVGDEMDADFRALDNQTQAGGIVGAGQKTLTVCKWLGVSVLYAPVLVALYWATFALFFGSLADEHNTCDSDIEQDSRAAAHWVMGWLPGAARTALLGATLAACCQKVAGVETTGLAQALLLGNGGGDGDASSAGWLAIVGGHPDGRPQSTWAATRGR